MKSTEEKLADALRVVVRDPYIGDWLKLHDPMAYTQARQAIEEYENAKTTVES